MVYNETNYYANYSEPMLPITATAFPLQRCKTAGHLIMNIPEAAA